MRETHRFDPERMKMLDSPQRREAFDPEGLLATIGVQAGNIGVDLGCGSGFFTLPLAERIGKEGKVFAVDVSEKMLSYLKEKSPPGNVELIQADIANTGLGDGIADVCVIGFVLHEMNSPQLIVKEIKRLLKIHGKALIIDWQAKEPPPGPPLAERIGKEDAIALFASSGFEGTQVIVDGENHYAIVAVKG